MLKVLVLISVALIAGIKGDSCDATGHPTYGVGMCVETANCPTLYQSGLCETKPSTVRCCFCPTDGHKFTHAAADKLIKGAGLGISSSGGCSDRNNPTCTSLEQVRCKSIVGIINFKDQSKCAVTITGGTEVGHSSGTQSHYNGYKIDTSLSTCVNNYITSQYTFIGNRPGDNAAQYRDRKGNIYARESNHWDITFI